MTSEMILSIGSLIVAIANAIAIVLTSVRNMHKVEEIHRATNSMKDQLVAATAKGSLAEGMAQGRADVLAEQKERS